MAIIVNFVFTNILKSCMLTDKVCRPMLWNKCYWEPSLTTPARKPS